MRPKRVLVAYAASTANVSTTREYLLALKNLTTYEVQYVHVTNDAQMHFDINEFDVLFHNSCARLCFDGYLSPDYERAVASFRGLKIAAVQDEYDRTVALHRSIRRLGFHIVFTSIQPEYWRLVYPKSQVPGVKLVHALTGYVPTNIPKGENIPLGQRKNWIAYRGRDLGAKYGRLGYEKFEIGQRMIEFCQASNIPHDIAMDEASRIYGDDWYKFLGNSRSMLGSESGANAFDFDGLIEKQCAAFAASHGRPPRYPDLVDFIEPFERLFDVGQISPRVFECAAMRTPMILFRGSYSDAMEAGIHYVPLEKDFSNANEIIAKLDDIEFLEGFADRAFKHLVGSGNCSYQKLADLVSEVIEEHLPAVKADEFLVMRGERSVPWTIPELSTHVGNNEAAVQLALGEKPSDYPQTPNDFYAKRELLSQLLKESRMSKSNTASGEWLHAFWHLVPGPLRYAFVDWLRRRIN